MDNNSPIQPENKQPPLSEDFYDMAKGMISAITAFRKTLVEWAPTIQNALSNISKVASVLLESIQQMQLSSYTQEELDEIKTRYISWGTYGWTPHPLGLNDEFQILPDSMQKADSLMLPLFTEEAISELYKAILDYPDAVPQDFEEAFHEYSAEKYRICALILFSLIERTLITTQSLDATMRENRKVSGGGIKNFSKQINNTRTKNMFIFAWILEENVIACLQAMYQNSANFKVEPPLINRHFIEHGMSNRETTKVECLKLFLLYHNVLFLSQWIESQPPYFHQIKEV